MENGSCRRPGGKGPSNISQLSAIFASKGWLNRKLRISYQNKKYWISCNEEMFFAYQINENCGISPGVPGWPVCIISKDYVFDESGLTDLTSPRLSTQDWLNIMANGSFELI